MSILDILHSSRIKNILGFALRLLSLGSRFVFTFAAVIWMTPRDFGIYGSIAAATMVINQIVGLEAYQVNLRQIAQTVGDVADNRVHYGRFVALSSILSVLSGLAFAFVFHWSIAVVLLTGGIVVAEYVGTEVTRILVAEDRSSAAMYSVSLRYLPWNLGFPIAAVLGVVAKPWPLEWVLGAWFVSSLLGSLYVLPVRQKYLAPAAHGFLPWYRGILAAAPKWLLVAVCWRFLETGVRLVPAFLINEVAAGHYVFLATLAAVGSTGLKAAIEPFWFVRMIRPDGGAKARRDFAVVTIGWLMLGAVASIAGLWAMSRYGHRAVSADDWLLLAILLVSAAALALSQVPHFALYAAHADAPIQIVSGFVLIGSIVACALGTEFFGLVGTALGTAGGALLMLAGKGFAARRLDGARPLLESVPGKA